MAFSITIWLHKTGHTRLTVSHFSYAQLFQAPHFDEKCWNRTKNAHSGYTKQAMNGLWSFEMNVTVGEYERLVLHYCYTKQAMQGMRSS